MARMMLPGGVGCRIESGAVAAEAEFHELVTHLARRALGTGDSPEGVRRRIVAYFLGEPTFRRADPHEQERVLVGLQRAIEVGLRLGASTPPESAGAGAVPRP